MGSLVSSFKFESYKIDELVLRTKDDLNVLGRKEDIPQEEWAFSLAFRKPQFFKRYNIYVGGLELTLELPDSRDASTPLVHVHGGIAGIFKSSEGAFPPEVEERIVKHQIPAILMPYLRASIMTLLATAGFGTTMLPLINIQEAAQASLKEIEILVVDDDPSEECAPLTSAD